MPYKDRETRRIKGREYSRQWEARQVLDPERFWQQVNKTATCWLWTARRNKRGYGFLYIAGKRVLTHRIAYVLLVGPIHDGLELDHLCRVHACLRPDHLDPVPHRINVLRGVGLAAQQVQRTQCPQGHPYDVANTYVLKGKRYCRECVRQAGREYRARQRGA